MAAALASGKGAGTAQGSGADTGVGTAPGTDSAAPAGLQIYVYYKLPAGQLAAAAEAALALQVQLCAAIPGLRCSLLRRPGQPGQPTQPGQQDGQVTLMETYAGPLPPDFELRLASAAAAFAALPPLRVVERFVPVA